MKVLALIPARGGSKGVPHKNIREIDGKPLIAYTIEVAIKCKDILEIWVSSDDPKILSLSKKYEGIKIHERPKELSTDVSPVTDTLLAVKKIAEVATTFDAFMILQPTSPIRNSENIREAIRLLEKNEQLNSVISVCPMEDIHPARMYWEKEGETRSVLPEFEENRRQEIPTVFFRNGSIYLVRARAFNDHHSVMVKPSGLLKMPYAWLLNIDSTRDILMAEALIPAWNAGKL